MNRQDSILCCLVCSLRPGGSILCCLVFSLRPCGHLLGKADILAILCVVFSLCFCGVPGQVWYLIASAPDLCLLPLCFLRNDDCKPRHLSCPIAHIFTI